MHHCRTRFVAPLAALALAACAAQVDGVPSAEPSFLPSTQEEAIILGAEDWDILARFEEDPRYHIGALYGRAIASVPGCTGWLISDDILVTAAHCGLRGERPITARFGQYSDDPNEADRGRALADARVALMRAGYPQSVAFDTRAISERALTRFTCDFVASDYPSQERDVEYWRCRPNTVSFVAAPFERRRDAELLPGHVWGHLEIELGERPDDEGLYLLSYNRPGSATTLQSVLLSPNGWIIDPDDTFGFSFSHNFEFTGADNVCGSSGGPVLDRRTHRAYGLQTGAYAIELSPDACDRTSHGTGWLSQQRWSNVGTYLGTSALAYTQRASAAQPLPSQGTHTSAWVGGSGGVLRDVSCPANHAARGVVYTEAGAHVGNFGIVCAPYLPSSDAGGADVPLRVVWDQATVIAGGSIDTGFASAANADWNAYWHERLTAPSAWATQQVLSCPPGTWLAGARVRSSASIDALLDIDCRELVPPSFASRSRTAAVAPFRFGPTPAGGTQSDCQSDSIVTGLRVRAGHWTDGMQLRCTRVYADPRPGVVIVGGALRAR